jgi:hypothetical protein
MQPYSNPTRRNIEDNLNFFLKEDDLFFLNGRQPQQNNATKNSK